MVLTSSSLHPGPLPATWGEPYELAMGDMVMFTGNPEHSSLHHRVVYRVAGKEPASSTSLSNHMYRFQVVFDFENPMGRDLHVATKLGTRGIKRLSLLDLATLRMRLDEFIKEWAASLGESTVE